jgi:hypothetical protein
MAAPPPRRALPQSSPFLHLGGVATTAAYLVANGARTAVQHIARTVTGNQGEKSDVSARSATATFDAWLQRGLSGEAFESLSSHNVANPLRMNRVAAFRC